jgi:hypothetical protein
MCQISANLVTRATFPQNMARSHSRSNTPCLIRCSPKHSYSNMPPTLTCGSSRATYLSAPSTVLPLDETSFPILALSP